MGKDEDKEDFPFSILKLGMINWRYIVYKKNQKLLFKAGKHIIYQLQKQLKAEMMKKPLEEDEEYSDSDIELESQTVSVGNIKVQYQKRDLLKQCLLRFS